MGLASKRTTVLAHESPTPKPESSVVLPAKSPWPARRAIKKGIDDETRLPVSCMWIGTRAHRRQSFWRRITTTIENQPLLTRRVFAKRKGEVVERNSIRPWIFFVGAETCR